MLEQGRFEPLELLLAAGLLSYEDYEAWRTGRREELQGALRGDPAELAALLAEAADYARRLKLEAGELEYRGWGASERALTLGSHAQLAGRCRQCWQPPADRAQLDLFQDSHELLLEEEIRQALSERRLDQARDKIGRLMVASPGHPRLQGFLRLTGVVDEVTAGPAGSGIGRMLEALDDLEPVARQMLGHRARDLLAGLWALAAQRQADSGDCSNGPPERHVSLAWQRAGRWEAVLTSIEAVPDWRMQPVLVSRHADAAFRRRDRETAYHDWMWLCWEYPDEAERTLSPGRCPDAWLAAQWGRFGDLDEPLETEDFPAWLLVAGAGLGLQAPLELAPSDERGEAYRLLYRLTHGETDIELRRALNAIHPKLLTLFLSRI